MKSIFKKKYSGAALDIDGLFLDTEGFQYKAWQIACDEAFKYFLSKREYCRQHVGQSSALIAENIARKINSGTSPAELLALREQILKGLIEAGPIECMPYAKEAIKYFGDQGVPIAFVTGGLAKESELKIEKAGLSGLMSGYGILTISREMVKEPKPSPEPYVKAGEILGVTKMKRLLSLEDSKVGADSARDAGTTCFIVPNDWTKNSFSPQTDTYHNLEQAIRVIDRNYHFQPSRA